MGVGTRASLALAAATFGVGALPAGAAEQPLSLGLTVDRQAWIIPDAPEGDPDFVLTGTISCTRSEPVDLFVSGVPVSHDGHIPCSGPEPQQWRYAWHTSEEIAEGTVRITVEGCTNPSLPIDEDCTTVERAIDIAAK